MTHQRLNNGNFIICNGNRYRTSTVRERWKAPFKHVLKLTFEFRFWCFLSTQATKGVKKRVKPSNSNKFNPYTLHINIYIIFYTYTLIYIYIILYLYVLSLQRICNRTECSAAFLQVTGCCVFWVTTSCSFLRTRHVLSLKRIQLFDPSRNTDQGVQLECKS